MLTLFKPCSKHLLTHLRFLHFVNIIYKPRILYKKIWHICIVISILVQAELYLSTYSGSSYGIYILCLMIYKDLALYKSSYLEKVDVNKYF